MTVLDPSLLADAVTAFALAQVRKGYDYGGIAGFLARKNLNSVLKWFCSELVQAAFLAAQIPILREHPYKVAPGDLRKSPLLSLEAVIYTVLGSTTPVPGPAELRIALYQGHSLTSLAICARTWSRYSHASLVLADNSVVESLPRLGVVHHPYIHELHKPCTRVEIYTVNWQAAVLCRGNM